MKCERVLKVGDWVEVLSTREVLATLDGRGRSEGLPFMPEMVPYCGERFKITAVMGKICGSGGRGDMRAVAGAPMLLLDELRCEGSSHGGCSRLCTLLWKASWLKPVDGPSVEVARELSKTGTPWPYPTRTGNGAYNCQSTALPQATVPMSIAEKLGRGLADVRAREWPLGQFLNTCVWTGFCRMRSLYRRFARAAQQAQPTPTERLALQPGEWVETKPAREIAATLDRYQKNRGLEFSSMAPYCGGKYRVKSRVEKFIDDRTGNMKEFKNTVILEGIVCDGKTSSGLCRRAECLYWREIWLRRTGIPGDRQR